MPLGWFLFADQVQILHDHDIDIWDHCGTILGQPKMGQYRFNFGH
jgi:hypothetical protein